MNRAPRNQLFVLANSCQFLLRSAGYGKSPGEGENEGSSSLDEWELVCKVLCLLYAKGCW